MPKQQLDIDKIIADNPNVDPEALKKAEEALKNLNQTGVIRRSTYGLETPESKKEIRHGSQVTSGEMPVRRLR